MNCRKQRLACQKRCNKTICGGDVGLATVKMIERKIVVRPGPTGPTGPTGPMGNSDQIEIGNLSFAASVDECKIIDRTGAPNHILDFVCRNFLYALFQRDFYLGA